MSSLACWSGSPGLPRIASHSTAVSRPCCLATSRNEPTLSSEFAHALEPSLSSLACWSGSPGLPRIASHSTAVSRPCCLATSRNEPTESSEFAHALEPSLCGSASIVFQNRIASSGWPPIFANRTKLGKYGSGKSQTCLTRPSAFGVIYSQSLINRTEFPSRRRRALRTIAVCKCLEAAANRICSSSTDCVSAARISRPHPGSRSSN